MMGNEYFKEKKSMVSWAEFTLSMNRFIESVNSAHDTILFFSLKYSLPIMAYDAAEIDEPISITIGEKESVLSFSGPAGVFGDFTGHINTCPVTPGTKKMLRS